MSDEALTGKQILDAGLDGWTLFSLYGLWRLHARIHSRDFTTGSKIVNSIIEAAGQRNQTPDVDLRPAQVDVRLTSGEAGGVTARDVELARRISDIAAAAGAVVECSSLASLELALDTPDHHKPGPFWQAIYQGEYIDEGEEYGDVGTPNRDLPIMWFQHSGDEEPRQRWHLDVWVAPDQVQPRINAALAAGGTQVDERILADPEGNKVCLCTWEGRI